jgi:hypothetical protein
VEKCIFYRPITVREGCGVLHCTDGMPKDELTDRGGEGKKICILCVNGFVSTARAHIFKVAREGKI